MASENRVGAHEVRSRFLSFFEAREHRVVTSSPLVPANDPTLLFTNAGMVQFKDVFTGRESREYSRATSSQRCLRAGGKHNDLDNVGFTPRHHTFFEMLGNFSFGDYFKPDAIRWAWEFLTGDLGIPEDRLVVSVFDGRGEDAPFDEEAYELWADILPRERIYKCPAKENFWQMGDTGPCGPCSEIHLYRPGAIAPPHAGADGRGPEFEDDTYLELWNLVFMQYEKHADGSMTQLPKPSIDTGAGLERVAAVMAGAESNYETELLSPLVDRAKALAGVSGAQGDHESPFQVIADHARATAFLISDGVFPDRAGRSYVLRRIMRRAIRYGTTVGLDKPFFHEVCAEVVDRFETAYPELRRASATIAEVVKAEEAAFRRTLDRGLRRLEGELDALAEGTKVFPVPVAAELYDTFGFPIDLTGVIAREHALALDEDEVEAEVHRRQSQGQQFAGQDDAVGDVYFEVERAIASRGTPAFSGYDRVRQTAELWAIVRDGSLVNSAVEGDEVGLVFASTPMYAESGGQVGDRGEVVADGVHVVVEDVRKPTGGAHVHLGRVVSGTVEVGAHLELRVDVERRDAIRRNHSATHLLHHSLREVLGEHVIQKGSLVAPDRLRFDFSHGKPVTDE
jgi:alanyl-tRNA synthetase